MPMTPMTSQDGSTWPKRILYVEDNPVNQLLMAEMVNRCTTHQLLIARNMREGLRLASQQRFDLLLIDLRLPDGYGTELLQMLRRLPEYAEVPAVAVTAEYGFDPTGHGFREVWFKPLDIQQTLESLERVLHTPSQEVHELAAPEGPEGRPHLSALAPSP